MPIQTGVNKKVLYKKEGSSTWGTKATAASGRYLRRVTSSLDLSKDTYQSNEIVSTYQVSDFRHGSRKVAGSINGELSPGSYLDFMASTCRRDFAAVANMTAVSASIAVGSILNGIQTFTLTRAAGDWYAGGVRAGSVIKVTTGLANAANVNRNLLVLTVTSATALVVVPLNGQSGAGALGPLIAEGPTASTIIFPGKITYVPASGHTNDSYSIEHWFADIAQSEVFTGCRVASLDVQLPASGIATCAVEFMGKDVERATSQWFSTTPLAASTKGVVAAVNGVVRIGSNPVGILTGLNFKVSGGMGVGQVVGSNYTPDVFAGRVTVSGQFTAYFDGITQRDAFIDETEISIAAAFATGTGAADDFVAFSLPRVKMGSATKSDGEQGLILTCSFTALYLSTGSVSNGHESTTLWIQDSNDTQA